MARLFPQRSLHNPRAGPHAQSLAAVVAPSVPPRAQSRAADGALDGHAPPPLLRPGRRGALPGWRAARAAPRRARVAGQSRACPDLGGQDAKPLASDAPQFRVCGALAGLRRAEGYPGGVCRIRIGRAGRVDWAQQRSVTAQGRTPHTRPGRVVGGPAKAGNRSVLAPLALITTRQGPDKENWARSACKHGSEAGLWQPW